MIKSPSVWNNGLANRGAMFVCSQASAWSNPQSCASWHRFGTMNEKSGRVLFARSVGNWENGTRFRRWIESFTTSERNERGLCFRAYPPGPVPV